MMKKVISFMAIILSIVLGFCAGMQMNQELYPPEVLNARQMNHQWDDIKRYMLHAVSIGGPLVGLNDEEQKLWLKEFHEEFEPMVFCHPFIILRRQDNSGYRVFINSDINNPAFDNWIAPTLDYRQKKENMGAILNHYNFMVPPRKENGIIVVTPPPTVFLAHVVTDTDIKHKRIAVALTNTATNDMFFYRDLDADGVFESVFHMCANLNFEFYSLAEFVGKFYNANTDEYLPSDNSLEESEISEAKP